MSNKKDKDMNKEQILNTIGLLSMSKGSYGRLYEQLVDNPELLDYLEEQNFSDTFELVMFIEG